MSDIRQYELAKELSELRTQVQVLTLQQARLADDADSADALQDKINELQKREIEKHKEWIQEIIYNSRDGLAFEVDRIKEREKKRDKSWALVWGFLITIAAGVSMALIKIFIIDKK